MKIVWLILVFSFSLFAQTDWQRWQKSEINYAEKIDNSERSYSLRADDPFEFLLKTAAVTYWFFISDVDGDNCPFDPSCSSFFLESVKKFGLQSFAKTFLIPVACSNEILLLLFKAMRQFE